MKNPSSRTTRSGLAIIPKSIPGAVVFVLCILAFTGCNFGAPKSDTEKKPDKGGNVKEGDKLAKDPLDAAQQAAQLAEKIKAIQKEAETMKPVDPVHFDKLQPLLPAAPAGYKIDAPDEGQTDVVGEYKQ